MKNILRVLSAAICLETFLATALADSDAVEQLQVMLKPSGGYQHGGVSATDVWIVLERAKVLQGLSPWDDGNSRGNATEFNAMRGALQRIAEKEGPGIYLWILQKWPEDDYVKQAAIQGLIFEKAYTIRDLPVLAGSMRAVNYRAKYLNMDTPSWIVPGYAVAVLGGKIDAVLYPEIGNMFQRPSPIVDIKEWLTKTLELALARCADEARRRIITNCLQRLKHPAGQE